MDERIQELLNVMPLEEKGGILELILKSYLVSGFGTLGKTDFETLLFHALLKMGCNTLSDYNLSMALQITPRKVQSLKERVSVKFPSLSRKEALSQFSEKLAYCRIDGLYIDVPINDIALKNHIEALLDEHNILLHTQLNSRIFRLRMDDLFDLLMVINPNHSKQEMQNMVIDALKSSQQRIEELNIEIDFEEKQSVLPKFKGALRTHGPKLAINILAAIIPGGTIAKTVVDIIHASI